MLFKGLLGLFEEFKIEEEEVGTVEIATNGDSGLFVDESAPNDNLDEGLESESDVVAFFSSSRVIILALTLLFKGCSILAFFLLL